MSRLLFASTGLFFYLATICSAPEVNAAERKILYVDSYHKAYAWSAGITRGIKSVLAGRPDIELKILRMDTKRNTSDEFARAAAEKVKKYIDFWQPDLVIASDDNASKYLIVPYYLNSDLPFVFCGVNWDAGSYGFPARNITGMLEVQLIDQILSCLRRYADGPRIAFIKGDDSSARKEADFFEKRFVLQLDRRFVTDFSSWKEQYQALQKEADLILVGNSAAIKGWDAAEAQAFVLAVTAVPTGNWDAWMAPYSLVTFATVAEEQGQWAAETALDILSGVEPGEIPITTNQRGKVYLNMDLAKKLGIKFPIELIERATFTSELDLK